MSIEALKKALKSKSLPKVVMLYGPEEYQKSFFREQMILAMRPKTNGDFSHLILTDNECSVNVLEDAVENVGFFQQNRLVEVVNLDFTKIRDGDRKRFLGILEEIPATTWLLFSFDSMFLSKDDCKKYKPLMDACAKHGICVEVTEPNRGALGQWVKKQFAFYQKEISTEDVMFLLDYSEGTMAALKQETEKLAGFVSGSVITRGDMIKVCTKSRKAHIFDVTNAVLTNDFDKALTLVHELSEKKEEPIALLSALSSTFSELYFTKACLVDGIVSSEEIGNLMGMAPNRRFLIKRYLPMAQKVTIALLRRCVAECLEADLDCKGSRIDQWQRIEMLLGKLLLESEKSAKRIG